MGRRDGSAPASSASSPADRRADGAMEAAAVRTRDNTDTMSSWADADTGPTVLRLDPTLAKQHEARADMHSAAAAVGM